jgi:hypothetical protein
MITITVHEYEKTDHFLSFYYWLKTCLNAQKRQKMGVFPSQSGNAIVSETRPFFAIFVRFVCLGRRVRL